MGSRHAAIQRAWASSYALAWGADAAEAALSGLGDTVADPMDRALHLQAYHVAAPDDRVVHWRHLRDEEAPLRRAALQVAGDLWDYDALAILFELEDDTDPVVRRDARALVRRFLIWGPSRPSPLERKMANIAFEPHDRAGLRAWREREPAWERRQAELMPARRSPSRESNREL